VDPVAEQTSFLFIVNGLPTNDDPEVEGSVEAQYVSHRWRPPNVSQGFFAQQPGFVYRWRDGAVTYAEEYVWESRRVGNYANGTIRDSTGTVWPEYYNAATVFFCNHFDKFIAARGDVGTREIELSPDPEDWWHPLFFHHRDNTSIVDHAGEHDFLAVRTATWIDQLLPNTYRRHSTHGSNQGGLAGLLPIIISLIAFSCTDRNELHRVLTEDQSWRGHRWHPHSRPHGREYAAISATAFAN
jgi:hypothetical protein